MKNYYILLIFMATHISVAGQFQWTEINVPHEANSYLGEIETPGSNTVWGSYRFILRSNEIPTYFLRTADGGVTWKYDSISSAGAPAECLLQNLYPIDSDTCYAAIKNNTQSEKTGIYKTKNGGNTWDQLGSGVIYTSPLSFPDFVYFWNSRQGVTVGDADETTNLEIYTTEDAGRNWSRVPAPNLPTVSAAPYSNTNQYKVVGSRIFFHGVVGDSDYIYRSDDFGLHWKSFYLAFPRGANSFWQSWTFTDSLHGFIMGLLAGYPAELDLYSTSDGGQTWHSQNYSGNVFQNSIANIPGTSTIVSADYRGMSYSTDLGVTWVRTDTLNHGGDLKYYNAAIAWSGEANLSASNTGGMYKLTSVLPLTLLNFNGTIENGQAILTWNTANEINNKGFDVERSTEGQTFSTIGFVAGHGTFAGTANYTFKDDKLGNGSNFYRVKQIDLNGKIIYSTVIKLGFNKSGWSITGNGTGNKWIQLQLDKQSKVSVQILAIDGKIIRAINKGTLDKGTYSFPLDLKNIASGVYVIRLIIGDHAFSKDILL